MPSILLRTLFILTLFSPTFSSAEEEIPLPPLEEIAPQYIEEEGAPPLESLPQFQENLVNMLTTLGLLLALVLGCAYILKKVLNAKMVQMNQTSVIKIVERRSLNPKSGIYLLEIEGKRLLVGESPSGLHPLGELPEEEVSTPGLSEFQTTLEGKKKVL